MIPCVLVCYIVVKYSDDAFAMIIQTLLRGRAPAMWAARKIAAKQQREGGSASSDSSRKRARAAVPGISAHADPFAPAGPQTARELFEWQRPAWNKIVDPSVPGWEDCRENVQNTTEHAPCQKS